MYLPESRITLLATENAFLTSVLMFSSFSHVCGIIISLYIQYICAPSGDPRHRVRVRVRPKDV